MAQSDYEKAALAGLDASTVTTITYQPSSMWSGGRPLANAGGAQWGRTSITDAVNTYYAYFKSGREDITAINAALVASGMVKRGASINKFATAYQNALTALARMEAGGSKNANLFDAISLLSSDSTTTGGSKAATYKDFATYTNDQIKQKATSAYQAILGRPPTSSEIRAFGRAIKAGAKAAPSITKVSANGQIRRTTQGFDENAFIAGYMANHIPGGASDYDGLAGQVQDFIASYKTNYGVMPTQSFVEDAIRTVVGAEDRSGAQQNLEQQLKEQAQILFPALKDKIVAGMTVRSIADPYIAAWSRLREVNDMNVGLDNQDVKAALSMQNDKGEYQLMNLDDFAKKVRSSSEWLNTNNAKETMLGAAESILQQFGFKR